MQVTNATWKNLLSANAHKEIRAVVGSVAYEVANIVSAKTTQSLGKDSLPVGNCVAAQLDLALWNAGTVPRMAEIKVYVRLNSGAEQSDWIKKGTYYVDTREYDAEGDVLTLHAYDAMLKTEQSYTQPGSQGTWPRTDTAVVADIAQRIGVTVDARTLDIMNKGYRVQYPGIRLEDGTPQYSADGALSMREVLGCIGVMYGGNWIISDAGALRLIPLTGAAYEPRSEIVTTSGSWTAPSALVGGVLVTGVGGGGGGGRSRSSSSSTYLISAQGGGGGSGRVVTMPCPVLPNQEMSVSIGAGGAAGVYPGTAEDGGDTSFGTFLTAQGGYAGANGSIVAPPSSPKAKGGDGGSGYRGGGGGYALVSAAMPATVRRTARGGKGGDAQGGTQGAPGDVDDGPGTATRHANGGAGAGGAAGGTNTTEPRGGAGIALSDGNTYGTGGSTAKAGASGALELDYLVKVSAAQPRDVKIKTLNTSPALDPISRVTLVLGTDSNGAEVHVTSGDDTGRELSADCPLETRESEAQAIADDLIAALGGYVYQPFDATYALLDPAAELGDGVAVGDIVSQLMSIVTTYDALYTADIGAPQDEEIDHEYPYQARQNREITQKLATTSAQLRVDVDSIETEVSGKIDEEDAKTLISQGIGGITLTASAGENQSTVSIKSDGITVDSAIVKFSNIVADSIVANSTIASPNISGGTIKGGTITGAEIRTQGDSGNADLTITDGAIEFPDGNDIIGTITAAAPSSMYEVLSITANGTNNNGNIILSAYQRIFLLAAQLILSGDGKMYGTAAQRDAIANPYEGSLFFVI